MKDSLERRVRRGIKLLDEKVPDWYNLINLEDFDISSCSKCILGQLGLLRGRSSLPYIAEMKNLGLDHWHGPENNDDFTDKHCGFDVCTGDERKPQLDKLGQIWVREIKKRRGK